MNIKTCFCSYKLLLKDMLTRHIFLIFNAGLVRDPTICYEYYISSVSNENAILFPAHDVPCSTKASAFHTQHRSLYGAKNRARNKGERRQKSGKTTKKVFGPKKRTMEKGNSPKSVTWSVVPSAPIVFFKVESNIS